MTQYASRTETPVEKSKADIEKVLVKYGASAFGYSWEHRRAVVQFKAHDRFIRLFLPLPDPDSDQIRYIHRNGRNTYTARADEPRRKAYEQAQRQVWRALLLVIKAKLEAVDAGITTFEDEFLAHVVLPNGQTVSEYAQPQIAHAYQTGELPSIVPKALNA